MFVASEACVVSFDMVDFCAIPADAALPKKSAATSNVVNRYSVCTSLLFQKLVCIFIIDSPNELINISYTP